MVFDAKLKAMLLHKITILKLKRKLNTLFSNPIGVYNKYVRMLRGEILPIYGEDYDIHWSFTSFKDKIILDLGADYGSTAYYFLRKGATRVIAVEGDQQLVKKLSRNFRKDYRVTCIHGFIDKAEQISSLILCYHPDLVKVDIEGYEKVILNVPKEVLKQANEWLIEVHSDELYHALSSFFSKQGFQIRSFEYGSDLKIMHCTLNRKKACEKTNLNNRGL